MRFLTKIREGYKDRQQGDFINLKNLGGVYTDGHTHIYVQTARRSHEPPYKN
jgi:hypothetical protein